MKKLFFFFVWCIFFSSCNKKPTVSDFSWLEGRWIGETEETTFFEVWQPIKEDIFMGNGGAVVNNDTIFFEDIQIDQRGDDIFYIANVEENGGPVDFKFTGYKNDSLIFENSQHDFPQRIIYLPLPGNKLYVCIDGLDSDVYSRIEFSYVKME